MGARRPMQQPVAPGGGGHDLLQIISANPLDASDAHVRCSRPMRLLAGLLAALVLSPALAQPMHGGGRGPGPHPMPTPPPQRRMDWEQRQQLREQVRSGQMSREEARARWRAQRASEPSRFSPEQREQLRRDVQDANRDLEKR